MDATMRTHEIRELLAMGDPFDEPPAETMAEDLQGWAGTDPLFHEVIERVRPEIVIEVGSWKGQSAIFMAEHCRRLGLDTCILCVDTWLGSIEHLAHPDFRRLLGLRRGRPTIYEQFLTNVRSRGLEDYITPLPQTSVTAAKYIWHRKIRADIVYIDAGHEYGDVLTDLQCYWKLLRPGGTLIGDDYVNLFDGLRKAADEFAATQGLEMRVQGPKFLLEKPLSVAQGEPAAALVEVASAA